MIILDLDIRFIILLFLDVILLNVNLSLYIEAYIAGMIYLLN